METPVKVGQVWQEEDYRKKCPCTEPCSLCKRAEEFLFGRGN